MVSLACALKVDDEGTITAVLENMRRSGLKYSFPTSLQLHVSLRSLFIILGLVFDDIWISSCAAYLLSALDSSSTTGAVDNELVDLTIRNLVAGLHA